MRIHLENNQQKESGYTFKTFTFSNASTRIVWRKFTCKHGYSCKVKSILTTHHSKNWINFPEVYSFGGENAYVKRARFINIYICLSVNSYR